MGRWWGVLCGGDVVVERRFSGDSTSQSDTVSVQSSERLMKFTMKVSRQCGGVEQAASVANGDELAFFQGRGSAKGACDTDTLAIPPTPHAAACTTPFER